jgi:hypothetical protein
MSGLDYWMPAAHAHTNSPRAWLCGAALCRKREKEKRLFKNAQKLQRALRGALTRRTVEEERAAKERFRQKMAATRLQTCYRRHLRRKFGLTVGDVVYQRYLERKAARECVEQLMDHLITATFKSIAKKKRDMKRAEEEARDAARMGRADRNRFKAVAAPSAAPATSVSATSKQRAPEVKGLDGVRAPPPSKPPIVTALQLPADGEGTPRKSARPGSSSKASRTSSNGVGASSFRCKPTSTGAKRLSSGGTRTSRAGSMSPRRSMNALSQPQSPRGRAKPKGSSSPRI